MPWLQRGAGDEGWLGNVPLLWGVSVVVEGVVGEGVGCEGVVCEEGVACERAGCERGVVFEGFEGAT